MYLLQVFASVEYLSLIFLYFCMFNLLFQFKPAILFARASESNEVPGSNDE